MPVNVDYGTSGRVGGDVNYANKSGQAGDNSTGRSGRRETRPFSGPYEVKNSTC